ncbi:hypothetical protein P20495_0205 [Pseudoalteromonas sp. BSi20495]|nr:hypothetical protein P20495_0205 [Pseudoalteromonas sp. BSi20495]
MTKICASPFYQFLALHFANLLNGLNMTSPEYFHRARVLHIIKADIGSYQNR